MLLTSAGRMLLDRTTGLIRQIEQVSDDLKSANGDPSGRVILGLVPTVSAVLSGRFARRVLDEFPDISLRIVESYGGHLVEWLHRGEMDLAIIYGPAVDLHLQVQSHRTRGHRRCWTAGVGPEQAQAGRPQMAGEAEAYPSKHLARPARAAGKGGCARATEADATDRGRFLPRPDQPDGARPRLYAAAALCDPPPRWRRNGWRWRRWSARRYRAN